MRLYPVIMALLLPLVLLARLMRGEGRGDIAERLGRGPAGPTAATLWLHGASNGELASARWVVEGVLAECPGLQVLITANTLTGRQMVRDWGLPGVTAALAPVDTGFAVRGVLGRWHPKALINLEAELWPTRFALCSRANVPVILIGARMSARSFRRWQWLSGFVRAALSHVRHASAQDAQSRGHLGQFGVTDFGPDLDLKAQALTHLAKPVWPNRDSRATWLLAASTHPGEEEVVLDAFASQTRFATLILAPRHPRRAADIAALLRVRGLKFQQRSTGQMPGQTAIFLADTMGEMDLWYPLCGACIIGGTFADKGGHTPWEPARHGCAILHGPSIWNFEAAFTVLDGAKAACTTGTETLAADLDILAASSQDLMAITAARVLQAEGDPNAFLSRILMVSGLKT